MLFVTFLPVLVMLVARLERTKACALHARQVVDGSNATTFPMMLPGDDEPSNPATTGYFINHLAINVRNATRSIEWWYKQAFGLRLLFHLKVSEHHSIAYMGHSHGGRNGTGYQSSSEMNRNKNNVEGLLELIEVISPNWDLPPGTRVPNTFSHIGVVVPNVTDTQVRLDAMGAKSWKRSSEPFTVFGAFADASGFTQAGDVITPEEVQLIEAVLAPINDPMIYAADPDGTIIEVQQQW